MSQQTQTVPAGVKTASWAAVWTLAVVVALLNAAEQLPASLLTPMAAGLDASEGLIGQSVTATAICAIATSLLIAPVTRRLDRRPVLLVLSGALVVSSLVVAVAPNAGIMLAARLVLGLTVGGVWGLSASLALRLVPSADVPKALAIIFGGGSVAMVAAPSLGAFFGGIVGWRGVFVGLTVIAAVVLVAQFFTLPSMRSRSAGKGAGLGAALRLPGLVLGMAGVMLMFGGGQILRTYIRPYLEQTSGMGTDEVSLTLFLLGATSLLGTVVVPRFLASGLRGPLALISAAQAASLVALFVLGGSPVAAMACTAVWGFFLGMVSVCWSTWVTREYPDHAEPAGGILVTAIQGSLMIGAMIGGGFIDARGVVAPVLAAAVVLALGAVYVLAALRGRATTTEGENA
ncbi:MFS transporter [Skermania sp. ID1734]|uniref:MFS transporter n=1 Tax=Skermania sp. ID1734 TaxID=2597516 RepID=UPI001C8F2972|nr:MFS transporter [Skermania sp. ID1734]